MGSIQTKLGKGIFTLAAAAALLAGSGQAALAKASVTGTDFYGNGEVTTSIDVLSVGGVSQEGIYLKVTKTADGATTTIADRLLYTMTDANKGGSTATDANRGAVVSLNIDGLDLAGSATYQVSAYADRAETDELYTGTIYSVWAKLSNGQEVLIGTHTTNDGTFSSYKPAQKLFLNNTNYALDNASDPTVEGTKVVYNYANYDEASTTTGTITYVDVNGTVIDTVEVAGITQSEPKTVDIPAVLVSQVDGKTRYFRTVFFQDKVTLSNPGQLSYTITCKWLGDSEVASAGYYTATIKMVDTDGNQIATDTVNVTGKYSYTLPTTIYKRSAGTLVIYKLNGSKTLSFDAATDGVTSGARTVEATYTKSTIEEAGVDVTFNLIDGTKSAGEDGRSLGTETVHLTSTSEADSEGNITAKPKSAVTVNGKVYKIAGTAAKYAYTFGSNASPSINVYYVPEDYTPVNGSYEVTVNYVNFLTKETIKSEKFTSSEADNEDHVYVSQESFSQDGVDYVRLDGQEDPIEHSYYSGIQTYTVYYRDVNDTLTSGTVINTIRVVYVDGTTGTTTTDGTATTAADVAGTTGAATTGAAGDAAGSANAGQLNADGTYNVADGDNNNSTLTNEAGEDSNSERINDEETPLAAGTEGQGSQVPAWAIGTGIAGAIGLAAALVFMFTKRSNKTDDEA